MSAYEQRIEPPDRSWRYLLFAAEPYETISFKAIRCSSYYSSLCGVLECGVHMMYIYDIWYCPSATLHSLARVDCS